jgi:hypothetical protein
MEQPKNVYVLLRSPQAAPAMLLALRKLFSAPWFLFVTATSPSEDEPVAAKIQSAISAACS